MFSLGLTSLPAVRQPGGYIEQRQQQQQAQPWSAFASSAGLEGWPAGDVQGFGARAAEPSLLEEALTSCGLQSLFPQLSGSSLDAANTAAGRCSSLGPSGSIKQGDFLRLPSGSALVSALLAEDCKGVSCSSIQGEHVAADKRLVSQQASQIRLLRALCPVRRALGRAALRPIRKVR